LNSKYINIISAELNLRPTQVQAVTRLLSAGAAVPFIAGYRKEMTGMLDEARITAVRDRIIKFEELDKKRIAVIKILKEKQSLTDELKEKLDNAFTLTQLEDVYLPYKPKVKTRSVAAKEKGLEELALMLFAQGEINLEDSAKRFINGKKGIKNIDDALSGAKDIIAEWISEDKTAREKLRLYIKKNGVLYSRVKTGKEEKGTKYKDYFDFKKSLPELSFNAVLSVFRGETEGFLNVEIYGDEKDILKILEKIFIKSSNNLSEQVKKAIADSYKRLLKPEMETEFRLYLKEKADSEIISVHAANLKQLLLAPPLGHKRILAIDPDFKIGCSLVCLDRQGELVHSDKIFIHDSDEQKQEAAEKIRSLCKKYEIEAIAIGNGTAGRETEIFVKSVLLDRKTVIVVVNENGAGIYANSEVARKEFADLDTTVRSAVSIGRRLMDPVAELVKIDPKSLVSGPFLHEVNQRLLRQKLDETVMNCVCSVGVDVNNSGKELIGYVSGLNLKLAEEIVEYRNANGSFVSREQLKKINGFDEKIFEQAAGFLRVKEGENPLDNTAVHPESYHIIEKIAEDLGVKVSDMIKNKEIQNKIDLNKYVTEKAGLPTLNDIMNELLKPGRDPRRQLEIFKFSDEVKKIEDLKPGMKIQGIVTNITNFGAFVDVGVQQDGLVHISQISDKHINNPLDTLKLRQKVYVRVLDVDLQKKRINLSMREKPFIKKEMKEKAEKIEMEKKLKILLDKFKKY